LLILSFTIFKRTVAVKKKLDAENATSRQELFQNNCKLYGLSNRELDVVKLILDGYSYKATAERLYISEKTVDTHMRNIYAKVGVKNKMGLFQKLYNSDKMA